MSRVSENNGFFKISSELLASGMPRPARDILLLLYHHRNTETGQCNPFQHTLGTEMARADRSVRRAVAWLKQAGFVSVDKNGRSSATYKLAPVSDWMALADRTKMAGRNDSRPAKNVLPDRTKMAGRIGQKWPVERDLSLYEKPNEKPNELESVSTNERKRGISTAASHTHTGKADQDFRTPRKPCQKTGSDDTPEDFANAISPKLIGKHPRPGQPAKARAIILRLCIAHADDMQGFIERLGDSHRAWREYWRNHPKVHKPLLWQWFDSGDWESPPTEDQRDPAWRVELRQAKQARA